MMENRRPEILIGYVDHDPLQEMKIREVSYGIEEEGCLQGIYDMKNNRDIRYTAASVAVILKNGSGTLLVNELGRHHKIYSIECDDRDAYRVLGKNAARYIKKLDFKGI